MVTTFAAIVTCAILISTIPLVLYAIGRLLPESHIVSRSFKYDTTVEILWTILTSIDDYPAWRSNIDRVVVRKDDYEDDINKYEDERRITFTEFTKKNRRTTVINIEQEPGRKLLRVVEERPYVMPGEAESVTKANTTFSGSWAFYLEPVQGEERGVVLKITEQGVIKKPIIRTCNMLFGNHRRVERFLKDLNKEVNLGILDAALREIEEETAAAAADSAVNNADNRGLHGEDENPDEGSIASSDSNRPTDGHKTTEDVYEAGPDDSIHQSNLINLNNGSMTESKLLDKEWDMMNEIYDDGVYDKSSE